MLTNDFKAIDKRVSLIEAKSQQSSAHKRYHDKIRNLDRSRDLAVSQASTGMSTMIQEDINDSMRTISPRLPDLSDIKGR